MNLTGRTLALVGVAALVVGATGAAGLLLVDDEDDDGSRAAATTTTTAPPTTVPTTVEGADTTTTTTATTAAAATTTTTTRPATSTTRAPATTATTSAAVAACGRGRAAVAFTAKDLVTDALSSSFIPQATVDNQVSAPIEVEEISIEISYPGGEVRLVRFATAGTVIAPGTSASFTADRITTARRYESVRFTRFTYFTQGNRASCRVTTP